MSTRLPSIPDVSAANLPDVVKRAILALAARSAIREAELARSDPLDKALTFRDALASNLLERSGSGYAASSSLVALAASGVLSSGSVPTTDRTLPPAVTGMSVIGGYSTAFVTFDQPAYTKSGSVESNHAYTEIWRADADGGGGSPGFAAAALVGQVGGAFFADAIGGFGQKYFYWARNVSKADIRGPVAGGTTGIAVTMPVQVEVYLAALTGAISESELVSSLNTRINLIDDPDTVAGSVAARVKTETDARVSAVQTEIDDRIAAVSAEAGLRTSGDATTLSSAQTYADGVGTATYSNAQTYVQTYTYSQSAIDAAESAQFNTLTANYQAADTTTYNSAVSYVQSYTYSTAGVDSAVAGAVTTIRSQFTGGYTGTDITVLTSGLIYNERVARANADDALTQQITLLSAGTGEQFDPFKIYYFDSSVESWTGNGTPTVSAGFIRPANHATDPYLLSPDSLGINGATYPQVRVRLRKTGTITWVGALYYTTVADTTWDETKKVTIAEPGFDGDGLTVCSWNTDGAWLTGTIKQIRFDLADVQDASNYFEFDWIAIGRPSPGASVAALLDEATARSSADSAEVTLREALSTKLVGAADPSSLTLGTITSGLLYDEKTARSDADSTEVTARQQLSAILTGQNDPTGLTLGTLASGLVYDEKTARASAVAVEAGRIDLIEADLTSGGTTYNAIVSAQSTANVKTATFVQGTTPTAVTTNDLWVDTANDNKIKRWTGATWELADDQRIGANASSITSIQSTLSAGGGYETRMSAVEVSASTSASDITGLEAQYTIKVQAGGAIAGIGLAAEAPDGSGPGTSSVAIMSDVFEIVPPGGGAGTAPFVHYSTPTPINGQTIPAGTYMGAAYIEYGSINTLHVDLTTANRLFAQDGTFGRILANEVSVLNASIKGIIQSDDYVTGVSGWKIDKAGSSEFSSVVVRGTVYATSGEFTGTVKAGSLILTTPVEDVNVWSAVTGAGKPENYAAATDANLIYDYNFAKKVAGEAYWASHAQATFGATLGENSTPGCQINANGAIIDVQAATYYPASLGDVFYVKARVWVSASFNGYFGIGTHTYNNSKVDQSSWPTLSINGAASTKGSWIDIAGTVTVSSASASYLRFRMTVRETATTGYVIFDRIYVSRAEEGATAGAQVGTDLLNPAGTLAASTDFLAAWNKLGSGNVASFLDANAIPSTYIADLAADKILAGALGVGKYIASTNYVADTSGWAINADGSAEFQNVKVRGDIEASTLKAGTLMVDTEHVQDNAVTREVYSYVAGPVNDVGSYNPTPATTVTITTAAVSDTDVSEYKVMLSCEAYGNTSMPSATMTIRVKNPDGTTLFQVNKYYYENVAEYFTVNEIAKGLQQGTYTAEFTPQAVSGVNQVKIYRASLIVQAFKK